MSHITCLINIHTHFPFKRTSVLEGRSIMCIAIQFVFPDSLGDSGGT